MKLDNRKAERACPAQIDIVERSKLRIWTSKVEQSYSVCK